MPKPLDSVAQDALVLPPDQRAALAYRLLASLEPELQPAADAAWDTVIARRIARFDTGETLAAPASEVFASLREIAPDP